MYTSQLALLTSKWRVVVLHFYQSLPHRTSVYKEMASFPISKGMFSITYIWKGKKMHTNKASWEAKAWRKLFWYLKFLSWYLRIPPAMQGLKIKDQHGGPHRSIFHCTWIQRKMLFLFKNKYHYTYPNTYIALYSRSPKLGPTCNTHKNKKLLSIPLKLVPSLAKLPLPYFPPSIGRSASSHPV